MVCARCLRAVQQVLEGQGYTVRQLELGRALIEGPAIDAAAIARGLRENGFELLTERNAQMVSQVKTLIITLIQSGRVASLRTTLSDYLAEQTGVDYPQLSHLFSTTEHLTIEKFWILQRVERAKELLSYGEEPIRDIAQKLGYSSAAYLTQQFRQVTGLTPAAYRRQVVADRNPLDWI